MTDPIMPPWQPPPPPNPYPTPGYPAPMPPQGWNAGYNTGYNYPAPPAGWQYGYPTPAISSPRVSPPWTGAVLALAGFAVAVGSFMTWAKLVVGGVTTASVAGTDGQRDGKITVVLGVLLLALGFVALARQGRLWVGITGIVLSLISALVALADMGDISNRNDEISNFASIDVGAGLVLVLIASLVALGGSIAGVCIRRA